MYEITLGVTAFGVDIHSGRFHQSLDQLFERWNMQTDRWTDMHNLPIASSFYTPHVKKA
jgi:hypothetical protein